jgi:hypothetical protein
MLGANRKCPGRSQSDAIDPERTFHDISSVAGNHLSPAEGHRQDSEEENTRIVVEGLRSEESISELGRREASPPNIDNDGKTPEARLDFDQTGSGANIAFPGVACAVRYLKRIKPTGAS